jgi:hypothetical protein
MKVCGQFHTPANTSVFVTTIHFMYVPKTLTKVCGQLHTPANISVFVTTIHFMSVPKKLTKVCGQLHTPAWRKTCLNTYKTEDKLELWSLWA